MNSSTPSASKIRVLRKFCPERARLWGEPRGIYLSMFFCYILECSDGSYYVGVTYDPHRRLKIL